MLGHDPKVCPSAGLCIQKGRETHELYHADSKRVGGFPGFTKLESVARKTGVRARTKLLAGRTKLLAGRTKLLASRTKLLAGHTKLWPAAQNGWPGPQNCRLGAQIYCLGPLPSHRDCGSPFHRFKGHRITCSNVTGDSPLQHHRGAQLHLIEQLK